MVSFRYPEERALRTFVFACATATALILMVDLGEAARGEICYSTPVLASQTNPLTNTTAFTCPTLGAVTIPQIYQVGWRVIQLAPVIVMEDPTNPLNNQAAWMVLIEGP